MAERIQALSKTMGYHLKQLIAVQELLDKLENDLHNTTKLPKQDDSTTNNSNELPFHNGEREGNGDNNTSRQMDTENNIP